MLRGSLLGTVWCIYTSKAPAANNPPKRADEVENDKRLLEPPASSVLGLNLVYELLQRIDADLKLGRLVPALHLRDERNGGNFASRVA